MSEPAWKRLGLKVKALVSHDPLAITPERLEPDAKVDKKSKKSKVKKEKSKSTDNEADSGNDKKRKLEIDDDSEHKAKKPPKKVKVPKSERKVSNVVKDQLVYMRQFSQDRANWKFSKQKQNWILKNIREIPEDFENDLIVYLQSVQGGSRDRIVKEMKDVVEEWNKIVAAAEEQIKKDLEEVEVKVDENSKEDDNDSKVNKDVEPVLTKKEKKKLKQEKQKAEANKVVVDYDYAVRANTIYEALTNEKLKLSGIEEEQEKEKEPETVVEVIEESVYL